MIGDTYVDDGVEFEVVWSGGEGLVSDRQTKIIDPAWTGPTRLFNKTGKYAKKPVDKVEPEPETKPVCRCYPWETVHAISCPLGAKIYPWTVLEPKGEPHD